MARTAFNEITINDLNDGTNPVTGYLTNNNHTFAANTAGTVSNRAGFSSTLEVFVGQTKATYDDALDKFNTFSITKIEYTSADSSGWTNLAHVNEVISAPGITDNAVADVIARVTFDVVPSNTLSVRDNLVLDISLSIVREGTGGAIIELAASRYNFTAASTGVIDSGQTQINVDVISQGNIGTTTWATSQDGGTFVSQSSTSSGAGGIAFWGTSPTAIPTDTGNFPATGVARVGIVGANLGNSNTSLTVKATGATGGLDAIGIYKVTEGKAGEASITVTLASSDGDTFKNGAGADKTISLKVYDSGTGGRPNGTFSYAWTYGNGDPIIVNSQADRRIAASGVNATGEGFPTIIVTSDDVSTQLGIGCTVTVTET